MTQHTSHPPTYGRGSRNCAESRYTPRLHSTLTNAICQPFMQLAVLSDRYNTPNLLIVRSRLWRGSRERVVLC